MRTSKRVLAGLAAGALGAGVMTFAALPAAQASTAATITLQYPSVTAVLSGVTAGTAIPVRVNVFDAAGDQNTSSTALTGQRIQVTITQPATADDTNVVIANATGGGVTGNASQNIQSAVPSELATLNFTPGSGFANWNALLTSPIADAGTYTITARLFNTSTGAVISTATMPLNLIANTATSNASVAFINGQAISQSTVTSRRVNVLDRLGVTAGTSVAATAPSANQSFALWVTDAAGGPYLVNDDSVTVTSATKVTGTIGTNGGWDPGSSYALPNPSGDLRVYYTTASGTYGTAGVGTLAAAVTTLGSSRGSGTLPLSVSSATSLTTAPQVLLTTTPAYEAGTNVYQVPPGTTKLSFTTVTANGLDDTTIPWNAWSTQNLTALSSSGGVINQKADTGAVEITVPAAATAAGRSLTLNVGVGSETTVFTVNFTAPAPDLFTATPLAQVGQAATLSGTITDQYGNPLPGTWAIAVKGASGAACSTTSLATATAAANGSFTLTIPASFAPATAQLVTFGLCASNGITAVPASGNAQAATVRYTATGGVTSLTVADDPAISGVSTTVRPLIKTPANGTASLTGQTAATRSATTTMTAALINSASNALKLTATVNPPTMVTYSGSEGVLFTERSAGAIFYQQADATADVIADSTTGAAPVSVIATKPGLHTVTVTAGTSTATYTLYAAVPNTAARVLEVTPAALQVTPNSFKGIALKVSDIFGNAVPFYNSFTLTQAGAGTLSPAVADLVTGADGIATQFYTAPAGTGDTRLAYAGGNWVTGAIAGAPDAVSTGVVNIKVALGPDPEEKTILIVGERGTVSGKPGILVDGDTTGFEDRAKMVPFVRFPGQSEYTAGSARPTVNAAGDFSWQRKTGKKTYVYFANEAGDVRSNRIIIPAN